MSSKTNIIAASYLVCGTGRGETNKKGAQRRNGADGLDRCWAFEFPFTRVGVLNPMALAAFQVE